MIHLPAEWPAEIRCAAHEAAARAEAVLTARDAGKVARLLFWKIFRQRLVWEGHRAEAQEGIMTRRQLAEAVGSSERSVSSALAQLRRWDLVFWGSGRAHRYNTPLLLVPAFLPKWPTANYGGDPGSKLAVEVIHRPSTGALSEKPTSHSHYKDLPPRRSGSSEDGLYSDPERPAYESDDNEQRRREAQLRRRKATGPRDAVWGSRQLAREFLSQIGPAPPEAPS